MGSRTIRFLLHACATLAAAVPVCGQQGSGTISGSVADQSNTGIANAAVTIRNIATNATFRTTTTDSGFFIAPNLSTGEYEVTVEAQGFKRVTRRGLTLQVDQKLNIPIALDVGAVTESIDVVGGVPLVDTGSSTLGKVVEQRRIQELPLNGRNALVLMLLTPGVKSNAGPTNSGFADRGLAISSISINGGPNALNQQLLDGASNILPFQGEVAMVPAVAGVQEFKVQSGAMASEFGLTAGGAVNLVSRSGTNEFHRSVYHFLRNVRDEKDATPLQPVRRSDRRAYPARPDVRLLQLRGVPLARANPHRSIHSSRRAASRRLLHLAHHFQSFSSDLRSGNYARESSQCRLRS